MEINDNSNLFVSCFRNQVCGVKKMNVQKRLLRFILKRTIGEFLLNKDFNLDQLDVELTNGLLQLQDLALDVNHLNGFLIDFPVALIYGNVDKIQMRFPWSNLWTGSCEITVSGLQIGLIPLSDLPDPGMLANT